MSIAPQGDAVVRHPTGLMEGTQTITPQMAAEILEKWHPHNRPAHNATINARVEAMIDKNWYDKASLIVFDEDDMLMDGQHRLMACVAANRNLQTLVSLKVPKAARPFVDVHRTRTTVDCLYMEHVPRPEECAATMRKILIIRAAAGKPVSEVKARSYHRNHEMLDWYNANQKAAAATAHLAISDPARVRSINDSVYMTAEIERKKTRPPVPRATLAALHWLGGGTALSDKFVTDVVTGFALVDGDPAASLRNWLAARKKASQQDSLVVLAVCISAWNAFATGTSKRQFKLSATPRKDGTVATVPDVIDSRTLVPRPARRRRAAVKEG